MLYSHSHIGLRLKMEYSYHLFFYIFRNIWHIIHGEHFCEIKSLVSNNTHQHLVVKKKKTSIILKTTYKIKTE